MTRLQCPRCEKHIDTPAQGDPVCPYCGFTAPYDPTQTGATHEDASSSSSTSASTSASTPAPEAGVPSAGTSPASTPPRSEAYTSPPSADPTQTPSHATMGYDPYAHAAPPSVPHASARTSGSAVASLILGLIAICLVVLVFFPVIGWISFGPAVLAIIFGGVAIGQCNRDPYLSGKGMAIAGLVLGIIVTAIGLPFRLLWLGL